jgi:hypothetical protein
MLQYTLILVATDEQVQHVFWGTMSVIQVSFPMATVTYCTVWAVLNNAVYKIQNCTASTATSFEGLYEELSYLYCHMLTDLQNVSEVL